MPQLKMMASSAGGLDKDQELIMTAWDAVPYVAPIVEKEYDMKDMIQELTLVLAIFILLMCFACAIHDLWRRSNYAREIKLEELEI